MQSQIPYGEFRPTKRGGHSRVNFPGIPNIFLIVLAYKKYDTKELHSLNGFYVLEITALNTAKITALSKIYHMQYRGLIQAADFLSFNWF